MRFLADRSFRALLVVVLLSQVAVGCRNNSATGSSTEEAPPGEVVQLPNKDGSFKFGVLGDFGTGDRAQFEMAEEMVKMHGRFKYETVVLLGDNLYGTERPQDYRNKFELPYQSLLNAGVKFFASLGNHDSREQRYYKPFNMDGKLYYTFSPASEVRFFVLESSYPVPEQIKWLEDELKKSSSKWKIAYFHHPVYSSGDRHGSDHRLREVLEPLFVKYNVSVVLQGHDHFYERVKPQQGITYFVVGAGGKLRNGRNTSEITARGYDADLTFMGAEIIDDQMYFNVISRTGQTVDSGVLTRRIEAKGDAAPPQASTPPAAPPAPQPRR